jgi:MscS family membrane protein
MMNLTSKNRFCRTIAVVLYAASLTVFAQSGEAASEVDITARQQLDAVFTARTGSPRQTLLSWLNLVREAENIYELYRQERTLAHVYKLVVNADDLLFLLDLSQMPAARRHEIGYKASYAIADILVRMELPPMESVPDWDPFDNSVPSAWRIPGTPITIARIDEGPRAGEFLFSARTVANPPNFFERIRHLPFKRPSPVESTQFGRSPPST